MKDILPGYFTPTETEFSSLWDDAIIVPDASVLLSLLRLGKEAREEVLATLKSFDGRLWIPHQIALEFAKNWRHIEKLNEVHFQKEKDAISKAKNQILEALGKVTRFSVIDVPLHKGKVEELVSFLLQELEEAAERLPRSDTAETIVGEIAALFASKTGPETAPEKLTQWYAEGKKRYELKTPPGYEDAKEKEGNDIFGDLVLWKQIVEHAATSKLNVIFITDDRKEDWLLKQDGRVICPRPELTQEFWKSTGHRFYLYQPAPFLVIAKETSGINVSAKSLEEVENLEPVARHPANNIERARLINTLLGDIDPIKDKVEELKEQIALADAWFNTLPSKRQLELLSIHVGNKQRMLDEINLNLEQASVITQQAIELRSGMVNLPNTAGKAFD